MDQDTTTPADVPEVDEQGAPSSLTEEGAAAELLSKWKDRKQPEQPQSASTEAEAEEAATPASQADASTDDGEAPAEDDGYVELDVAGTKYRLPKAAEDVAKALSSRIKDFESGANRKYQEAAELRKATEAERAAVAEMRKLAEAHADLMADARTVARRMQQIEGLDFSTIEDSQVARLNAEYTQLSALSKRIEASLKDGIEQHRAKDAEALRARQEHAQRIVEQRIKGWGPELQKELAEYAVGRGAPVEALNGITEPWMVEILADAAYGRKMREHKSTQEKRVVQTPPTVKPGPATGQPSGKAKADAAMVALRKSGRTEDAAAALLARLRR